MVKKVRSPKQIARIKSPKYSKFPISIKRITPRGMIKREIKKIGAFNIPSAVWRAGHPKPTRKPMPETMLRRGINVPKAILKSRQKVVDSNRELYIERLMGDKKINLKDYNLIEVEISSYGYKEIERLRNIPYVHRAVLMIISRHLRNIWRRVNTEYYNQYRKIAKDTGALRSSLKRSLGDKSTVIPPLSPFSPAQIALKMGFNSDLPYAEYISKGQHKGSGRFITLKHAGSPLSFRTGRGLIDPLAEKYILSYDKSTILRDFRRVIRYGLVKLINYTAKEFNISHRQARKFYLIKHIRGTV